METRAGALKSKNRANSSSFHCSKNPKKSTPRFGFLETRAGASKSKKKQANSSSFQNSKPWGGFFGFLEFWKLEEFARFLDSEEIPRVSKVPNLEVGFWILGILGTRFLDFEAPARVSKIPNLGVDFFGVLETRGILECWSSAPFLDRLEMRFQGLSWGGGGVVTIYIYIYTHTYTCVCVCVRVYICVYVYKHIRIDLYLHLHTHVSLYGHS